jgi:hypothetical protein
MTVRVQSRLRNGTNDRPYEHGDTAAKHHEVVAEEQEPSGRDTVADHGADLSHSPSGVRAFLLRNGLGISVRVLREQILGQLPVSRNEEAAIGQSHADESIGREDRYGEDDVEGCDRNELRFSSASGKFPRE